MIWEMVFGQGRAGKTWKPCDSITYDFKIRYNRSNSSNVFAKIRLLFETTKKISKKNRAY